jgi:hypothetical protein
MIIASRLQIRKAAGSNFRFGINTATDKKTERYRSAFFITKAMFTFTSYFEITDMYYGSTSWL